MATDYVTGTEHVGPGGAKFATKKIDDVNFPKQLLADESGNNINGGNPLPVTAAIPGEVAVTVADPVAVTIGATVATSIADGADAAQGTTTDVAYSDTNGAAAGTSVGLLKALFKKLAGTLHVAIDQTTPGTTNLVSVGVDGKVSLLHAGADVAAGNALPVTESAGAVVTGQVTISTSATPAARAGRKSITVVNHSASAMYVGASGVTTSTGILLPGVVGASITLNTTAALYAVLASGSQTASYVEAY